MVTAVTVSSDPIQSWQQKALAELERVLQQPLELWSYDKLSGWSRDEKSDHQGELDLPTTPTDDIVPGLLRLIQSASDSGSPSAHEQCSGQFLFVLPLDAGTVATTSVQTDNPELILRLTDVSRQFFVQQAELARLREENDFFLKQVSDDFEELTFLRSMAERLGLGDSTHTLEQLVRVSLPELGKSAHAEEMYFVVNSPEGTSILASWHTLDIDWLALDVNVLQRLILTYQNSSNCQPVIKNGFDLSEEGQDFFGVRDFVIVPVIKSETPFGWFVAINRLPEDVEATFDFPEWRLNQHEFGTSEASLLSTAAAMTASHASNISLFQERETLLVNVVRTLVSAVEAKDQYTCGHSERVALYGKRLAAEMGYDEEACELLYLTGLLHDVGKIAINDAILNKPDRLTDEEFAEIQRHPEEGWKILQELQQLSYVLPGVLHHHERMDGKGYPDGLQQLDIPLDGRILAVADAYDAMTSDRAYRTGMPHEKAIAILRDGAGTQWDTEAINAFLAIAPEMVEIRESYEPRSKPNRTPTPGASRNQT